VQIELEKETQKEPPDWQIMLENPSRPEKSGVRQLNEGVRRKLAGCLTSRC
jgi:hypothetical protein